MPVLGVPWGRHDKLSFRQQVDERKLQRYLVDLDTREISRNYVVCRDCLRRHVQRCEDVSRDKRGKLTRCAKLARQGGTYCAAHATPAAFARRRKASRRHAPPKPWDGRLQVLDPERIPDDLWIQVLGVLDGLGDVPDIERGVVMLGSGRTFFQFARPAGSRSAA
jgi:hypothetical protein